MSIARLWRRKFPEVVIHSIGAMMPSENAERDAVIERILRHAASDADFRAQLLANPHQAAARFAPGGIPARVRVQFIEKPPGIDALYVLPPFASRGGEISDDELEAIAGGGGTQCDMWSDESCGETCGDTDCLSTCGETG
jgi:hypothetical protein